MHTARRTHGFTESVIRGMTRLAAEHDAINLAQGFPNFPCPAVLKEAAARAIRDDLNQYAITWGAKRLRGAPARSSCVRPTIRRDGCSRAASSRRSRSCAGGTTPTP